MKTFILTCALSIAFSVSQPSKSSGEDLVCLGISPVANTDNCYIIEIGVEEGPGWGLEPQEYHEYCCTFGPGSSACGGLAPGSGCFLYDPNEKANLIAVISEIHSQNHSVSPTHHQVSKHLITSSKLASFIRSFLNRPGQKG
jgi:hypothetical protein